MRCEKMHATIPESTCLARQKQARSRPRSMRPGAGGQWQGRFLECVQCDQGQALAAGGGNGGEIRRAPEPAGERSKREDVRMRTAGARADATSTPPGEKKCRGCKRVKPISKYSVSRANADGHKTLCKECDSEYQRANRLKQSRKSRKSQKAIVNAKGCLGLPAGETVVDAGAVPPPARIRPAIRPARRVKC